jgi:catechol 2,3-dioxygenase-like lactoylglutathione lyase family enzyme
MSRLQLALRVSDVDRAVDFYERVFATPVTKRRPGYANFAIADPPLKLVLIEGAEGAGGLDHIGVETLDADEQAAFHGRLEDSGLVERVEEARACCYATQDKAWVADPDGLAWEVYRVLGDADALEPEAGSDCCVPSVTADATDATEAADAPAMSCC